MLTTTLTFLATVLLVLSGDSGDAQSLAVQRAVQARAVLVILDVASGRVLERSGDVQMGSAPGSVLKSLILMTALRSGAVRERETIACRGTLVIAGHNLACSHPRDVTVLDARQALAESCNTYFATLAERMPSATVTSGLRSYGVLPLREPRDGAERALLALGLQDAVVSPMQLAQAYRKLALQINEGPSSEAKVVRDGLLASVKTGMANAARAQGVALGGKTGTVDDAGGRSHGWFAGLVFSGLDARTVDRVIVVYVPNGNGADAAAVASAKLSRADKR